MDAIGSLCPRTHPTRLPLLPAPPRYSQAAASTPEMERALRQAAKEGDEAALKALLDAKVVNIEATDGVSGWVGGSVAPLFPCPRSSSRRRFARRYSGGGGAVHESPRKHAAL